MDFLIAAHSDIGTTKKTNQDSVLVKIAQTSLGKVCLCVVCDGMGGLSSGELASATVIRVFDQWFEQQLPEMLAQGFQPEELRLQWDNIVVEQNQRLAAHASRNASRMGTTIVAFLIVGDQYYIMNVGDSRAYMLTDSIYQLTKDQTYVQYEIELGHMTWEEAQVHPQRNVLLQCVGASEVVKPDYFVGQVKPDMSFVLCSDGFRHVISPDEIYDRLKPQVLTSEQIMRDNAVWLTELNKSRREVDNISVAVIRTYQEG